MWKRMLIMLGLVALFIAGIAYLKYRTIQAGIAMGAKFAPQPTAVTTVVVQPQTWQPVLSAVGTLKAVNGVTVSTDMAGIVSEIAFQSGTSVHKGDVLVKFDTEQEEAQLHSAEARRDLSEINLQRTRELAAKKTISASEFDTAQSQFREASAAVDESKALIARKQIRAPFDGMLGIRQANVGQYLNAGAAIVPLQSLDPIYVEFALPQQHLGEVKAGKKLRLSASGIAGEEFAAEITAIDSRIDEATRNIMVQGTARNTDRKLRPGMFVNVEVLLAPKEGVVAVPSSSISFAPYGNSVFIVRDKQDSEGKPSKEVEQHVIKLGASRGDQVSIESGVKPGDEVVTSGVFKLRANAPVQINNSVQPSNDLKPTPEDT